MKKEEVQSSAFQIIAYAGEAIDCFVSAVKLNKQGKIADSWKKYHEGKDQFIKCHQLQTDLIFAESKGDDVPYSLIMTHAQDHYNTAYILDILCPMIMEGQDNYTTENKE